MKSRFVAFNRCFGMPHARSKITTKKTTTATSYRTPPNNGANEQDKETARTKYYLVCLEPSEGQFTQY